MAFCNSCGANLDAGDKFCSKCGAAVSGGPVPTSYPQAPPAQRQGSGTGLRIVLAAAAGLLVLGLAGAMAGLFIARNTKVQESNGKVRVQSPFGTVETTKDPAEAAKQLGIETYPGARALQTGSASVDVGGSHTVAVNFETDDPPEKVADFYKSKFPDAKVTVTDGNRYSIVSMEAKNIVSIHIEPQDDKTMIHIATVKGDAVLGDTSKD